MGENISDVRIGGNYFHQIKRAQGNIMLNFVFRLLLTFNATSLFLIIYAVNNEVTLNSILPGVLWLKEIPAMFSYVIYMMIPVFLTWIGIVIGSKLGHDSFKKGDIEELELANNSFLPNYLGYFFVALSTSSVHAMWFVCFILFIFTFLSQAIYFNPLFLLFGYEFYSVRTVNGSVVSLISRNSYKNPVGISIERVQRVNDYTFLEVGAK